MPAPPPAPAAAVSSDAAPAPAAPVVKRAPPRQASSQDAADVPAAHPDSDSWGGERTIGEHRFPVAAFVPSVLTVSYLGVHAGVEYHAVPGFAQLPSLVDDAPQRVDLRTVNVAEDIDFSVRLHDRIAVFGDAYGRARVGANISTLLGTGADYTYGADAGLAAKLLRVGGFQLGLSAQVGYFAGQSAGILTLFNDLTNIAKNVVARVQQNPTLDLNAAATQLNQQFFAATADLLTPFDGFAYMGSINFAQGIGRYVGLQAAIGFAAQTTTYTPTHFDVEAATIVVNERVVHTTRPNVGLAADLDLDPTGIPIDLLFEYRLTPVSVHSQSTDLTSTESALEQLIGAGVYYSGRSDLQFGLTGYALFGQVPALGPNAEPSGNPRDLGAQFVFRYFW